MGARRFRELFDEYEEASGIEHVAGRGWHAMRRSLSDAMDEVVEDQNVRNAAGAWALGSDTRDAEYRDGEDPRLIIKTRQAVQTVRSNVIGADPEVESLRQQTQALIGQADRAHLEAALKTLQSPKPTPGPTPRVEAS